MLFRLAEGLRSSLQQPSLRSGQIQSHLEGVPPDPTISVWHLMKMSFHVSNGDRVEQRTRPWLSQVEGKEKDHSTYLPSSGQALRIHFSLKEWGRYTT